MRTHLLCAAPVSSLQELDTVAHGSAHRSAAVRRTAGRPPPPPRLGLAFPATATKTKEGSLYAGCSCPSPPRAAPTLENYSPLGWKKFDKVSCGDFFDGTGSFLG